MKTRRSRGLSKQRFLQIAQAAIAIAGLKLHNGRTTPSEILSLGPKIAGFYEHDKSNVTELAKMLTTLREFKEGEINNAVQETLEQTGGNGDGAARLADFATTLGTIALSLYPIYKLHQWKKNEDKKQEIYVAKFKQAVIDFEERERAGQLAGTWKDDSEISENSLANRYQHLGKKDFVQELHESGYLKPSSRKILYELFH